MIMEFIKEEEFPKSNFVFLEKSELQSHSYKLEQIKNFKNYNNKN